MRFRLQFLACVVLCTFSVTAADKPAPASQPAIEIKSLTLLTYNVLFHDDEAQARGPALVGLVKEADADFIAFQETSPWFLRLLYKEDWAGKYHGTEINGKLQCMGGLYILSKHPVDKFEYKKLPSKQDRMVLIAQLQINGRSVAVATVHLDSPPKEGQVRAWQLEAVFPLLKDFDDAILMGDFNFDDDWEPETSSLDADYVDSWPQLKQTEPGHTWNVERNPMAAAGPFADSKTGRIDRILLRSSQWGPSEIRIIGDSPVSPEKEAVFPSDHFGLVGRIELRRSPDPTAPDPSHWEAKLGHLITVEGTAHNAKAGALVSTKDGPLYMAGMSSWPGELDNRRLRVTGTLIKRYDLPVFIETKGMQEGKGPFKTGIPVPPGTDLREAAKRYLLENAKWEVVN